MAVLPVGEMKTVFRERAMQSFKFVFIFALL
jgi:hypothetical protein